MRLLRKDPTVLSAPRTHILFDFFGTLVEYSTRRAVQDYTLSYEFLRRLGATLSYPDYLTSWNQIYTEFDRRSEHDDHEFSLFELDTAYLTGTLGRPPAAAEVEAFSAAHLREWNTGVRYSADVAECVRGLARDYRLAVVTNTHRADLVPAHLEAMGLRPYFDAVITSVEVGWRKPHPKIYATALGALGVDAGSTVFVGDSYRPDFVGPERVGIPAFLIDPHRKATVPDDRRLTSILDLPDRLQAYRAGDDRLTQPAVPEHRR